MGLGPSNEHVAVKSDTPTGRRAIEGADRDGLAAVAILLLTVAFIVVVLIALIG